MALFAFFIVALLCCCEAQLFGPPRQSIPASSDRFYTALFESSTQPWVRFFNGNGFSQRYLISNSKRNNLFCETKTIIRASPARVLQALRGPWTWWKGGAYDNRKEVGNVIQYELWPALAFGRRAGVHVFEEMEPAIPIRNGFRIPINLRGSCSGQAYFELTSTDGVSTVVVGRFAAVSNHVPVMTDRIFVETHLKAERGGLRFPFKPGTGWPGLKSMLESEPKSIGQVLKGR